MKNVLITGCQGYIGTTLGPYLQSLGYNVEGYDLGLFEDCLLYNNETFPTKNVDIRDVTENDIVKYDAVIMLAGVSNDPFNQVSADKVYNPTRDYSLKIAQFCKKHGKKFIFASSCSIYGKGDGSLLTEESIVTPQTPYSQNKLEIEEELKKISNENFTPICLRFATVFGESPRMRFDIFVNMMVGQAISTGEIVLNSDGQAWRPSLHMLDLCATVERCLRSDIHQASPLILNVGLDSENCKILDVAELITKNISHSKIVFLNKLDSDKAKNFEFIKDRKLQDGVDTRTYKVSFAKLKHFFPDLQLKYSLELGIKQMIAKFNEINLSKEQFYSSNFYRLQHVEKLHKLNLITDELRWVTKK